MRIGKYFTLSELTVTKTGLVNVPSKIEVQRLSLLVENILDPLRELYGKPIIVNSGYRSPLVNSKTKGASKTSDHMAGCAADIDTTADNALLFKLIRDNFKFDQLIWENGDDKSPAWIHVSYRNVGNRNQIKKFKNGKYEIL